jgi:hypothetical protein
LRWGIRLAKGEVTDRANVMLELNFHSNAELVPHAVRHHIILGK